MARYKNFAPRVGFAYDVSGNGNTSIRGGAGMFFDTRQSGVYNNRFVDVTPFSPQMTYTDPVGPFSNPYGGQKSPFPSVFPPPKDIRLPAPVLAMTYEPSGIYKVPVIYNWNLAIEQPGARRLARARCLRRLPRQPRIRVHRTEPGPLHTRAAPSPPMRAASSRGTSTCRWRSFAGNSGYNSFQASMEKRL